MTTERRLKGSHAAMLMLMPLCLIPVGIATLYRYPEVMMPEQPSVRLRATSVLAPQAPQASIKSSRQPQRSQGSSADMSRCPISLEWGLFSIKATSDQAPGPNLSVGSGVIKVPCASHSVDLEGFWKTSGP